MPSSVHGPAEDHNFFGTILKGHPHLMAEAALADLKVLDLTHYIAGPYCTKLLADYGADVIKIERPDGGDPARRYGPFPHDEPHPEKSALFLHLNTNKRGITLNLKSAAGRDMFTALVRQADIVVENFSPRVMPSLGLAYETLERLNPELVMTSISNFGQTGPYRDYKAQDILIYAMGGPMHQTGVANREPIKMAGNLMQYQAGTMAATATLVGVYAAQLQRTGQHIDISLFETHAGTVDRRSTFLTAYAYAGEATHRQATGPQGMLPRGIYPCQDGYICIHVMNEWWPRLARMLERPDLLTDPEFATPTARMNAESQAEFDALFYPWLLERTKQEIMECAQAARVLATAVNTPEDVLKDRHFRDRDFFVEITHPDAGCVTQPGAPFRMSETPWRIRRCAPRLGQHNEEVYGGMLGLSREELVVLREQGII
jgi:crotonobetainyl-CoA:carnitine CoA-transferase CaiB-like acyl-CoA transferase